MGEIFAAHMNSYHGFELEEGLKSVAEAGFKYCELAAVRGWTEHVMPENSPRQLEKDKMLLEKYGITPISLSGHCNLMDEKRLKDFEDNIRLAAEFGCKYIITSTGEAHHGENEIFTNDGLIHNIKKLLPILQENNIKLALETHGIHNTGSKLESIIKGVNSPYVGICYDTANCFFYGKVKPEDDVDSCINEIFTVHLKDHRGPSDKWDFPGLGKGDLNLKAFMDKLSANGFEGVYAVEIEYTEEFDMRDKVAGDIKIASEEMKASYEWLKKMGKII